MKLPEKEWFSITEIAERWGCDLDHVWHYVQIDALRPSIFLDNVECGMFSGGEFPGDWLDKTAEELDDNAVAHGLYYLPKYRIWSSCFNTDFDLKLSYVGFSKNKDDLTCWIYPKGDLWVMQSDLVIAREERDRFENEHGASPANTKNKIEATKPDEPTPKERRTWAQIVKVLCAAQGIDLSQPLNKSADQLRALGAMHGVTLPAKNETLAGKLKQARDID